MKKRFVALMAMMIALCWATSAMAATAIAPKSIDVNRAIMEGWYAWNADSSNADFIQYQIDYINSDTFLASSTFKHGSEEDELIIWYTHDGQVNYWEYKVIGFIESTDLMYMTYRNGKITEVELLTDYYEILDDKVIHIGWDTDYYWQFDTNQWKTQKGEVGEGIPPFNAADYPLTITWVDVNAPSIPDIPTLQQAADGKFYYYNANGEPDTTFSAPDFAYEGGRFLVVNGVVADDKHGVQILDGVNAYFYAYGKVQEVSQLAEYDGEWFVVENGKVNLSYKGFYDYNGGTFLITDGQLRSDYTGPWIENGVEYSVVNGQVW